MRKTVNSKKSGRCKRDSAQWILNRCQGLTLNLFLTIHYSLTTIHCLLTIHYSRGTRVVEV